MQYGNEFGAISANGRLIEKNMTLEVAKVAAGDLRQMGYRVFLTRTTDRHVNTPPRDWNHDGVVNAADELVARNVFANRHHANVFVAIHFDGSTITSIRGTHGFYCPSRPFWPQSRRLADLITASLVSNIRRTGYDDVDGGVATDVSDIVPQEWPNYPWFLTLGPNRPHRVIATNMPGALIETLYISNLRDDAAMGKPAIVAAIGRGYADGIKAYFHGRVTH